MVDLRDNIGWLIGSIGGVGAIILGYLQQYEFLGALLATTIGAGIAYFVQTKTQEKTWKREYSVKIVEEVYGDLFRDIKGIIRNLEKKFFTGLTFQNWTIFQEDHRYFMVDEKFRNRLDLFSQEIGKYNDSCFWLDNRILPKIMKQVATKIFGVECEGNLEFGVTYNKNNKKYSSWIKLNEKLRKNYSFADIKEDALRYDDKLEISNVELTINFLKTDGSSRFNSSDSNKIEMFWESCLKMLNKNETYQFIISKNEVILREAKSIRKELIKRIEEPWKI